MTVSAVVSVFIPVIVLGELCNFVLPKNLTYTVIIFTPCARRTESICASASLSVITAVISSREPNLARLYAPNFVESQSRKRWFAIAIRLCFTLACSRSGVQILPDVVTAFAAIKTLSTLNIARILFVIAPVVQENPFLKAPPAIITDMPGWASRRAAILVSVVITVMFCFADNSSARQ